MIVLVVILILFLIIWNVFVNMSKKKVLKILIEELLNIWKWCLWKNDNSIVINKKKCLGYLWFL